jgi:hypothetical protein
VVIGPVMREVPEGGRAGAIGARLLDAKARCVMGRIQLEATVAETRQLGADMQEDWAAGHLASVMETRWRQGSSLQEAVQERTARSGARGLLRRLW